METHRNGMTAEEIHDLVGESPTILEVGAHAGIDTVKFLKAMPKAMIFCFEPDQRPIKRFKEAIGNDPRVTLYETAVADEDGMKWFYASTGAAGHMDDWDYSGSLRKPTGHYEQSPEIEFKSPVLIPCMRLDTWYLSCPLDSAIDFAWIDIQGAQRDFIAGAMLTLGVTRYLYIEAHRTPLYKGETTQDELIALLPGFEPLALYGGDNLLFRNRHNLT